MIGGFKRTASRIAIAAAAGLFTGGIALTPVQAADLGGDCCADLEERVAELEATTVRKGNRKVSLKLSGQVARQLMWWDDGERTDVFYTENGWTHTRMRLTGGASISANLSAGFHIEHDYLTSNDPICLSNRGPVASCTKTDPRKADIWLTHKGLGKLSWGRGDTASNGSAEVDLSGTKIAAMDSGATYNVSIMEYRTSGGTFRGVDVGKTWSNLDGGSRDDRIRYDTPSLAGFTFSVSTWADDTTDVALRFKKEWNSVRCAAAVAYLHDTDNKTGTGDKWQFSTSGSCIHTPSGLNLTLAAGNTDDDTVTGFDNDYWWGKLGISRRWNSHGVTSIAVSYGEGNDFGISGFGVGSTSGQLDTWGIGFVQNIDAAALELYLAYFNYDYKDNSGFTYQDFSVFTAGGRIRF